MCVEGLRGGIVCASTQAQLLPDLPQELLCGSLESQTRVQILLPLTAWLGSLGQIT